MPLSLHAYRAFRSVVIAYPPPRRYMDNGDRATPPLVVHIIIAITPMTSSINHTTSRRMSTSRYAGTNRTPVPARRPDETTRDT